MIGGGAPVGEEGTLQRVLGAEGGGVGQRCFASECIGQHGGLVRRYAGETSPERASKSMKTVRANAFV